MKVFNRLILTDSLTANQFDQLISKGYFPTQEFMETITHLIFPNMWEGRMVAYKVYPLRFEIKKLKKHQSHRRIYNDNKHFTYKIEEFTKVLPEHKKLYKKYLTSIDFNRNSRIEGIISCENASDSNFNCRTISVYDGDNLIALGFFYLGEIYGTSILHIFDPAYKKYSLGKYMILLTVEYLKQLKYPFYSPGYIVNNFPKFDYKLFLGAEAATVYHHDLEKWKKFHPSVLVPKIYSIKKTNEIIDALNGYLDF